MFRHHIYHLNYYVMLYPYHLSSYRSEIKIGPKHYNHKSSCYDYGNDYLLYSVLDVLIKVIRWSRHIILGYEYLPLQVDVIIILLLYPYMWWFTRISLFTQQIQVINILDVVCEDHTFNTSLYPRSFRSILYHRGTYVQQFCIETTIHWRYLDWW